MHQGTARDKWIDFVAEVKRRKEKVGEVICGFIDQYMRGEQP
jgi:hypothetical protein